MAVVIPYAIQLGVSIALSYIAGQLLEEDVETPVRDFKPTPSVERGSPIALLLGRDEIAPVMLWAGDRNSRKEDVGGGGKGLYGGDSSAPKGSFFSEVGWHALCIGPVRRLWKITENGRPIFVGPIDPSSHPPGSLIDLGKAGAFRIYWGTADQPGNVSLADPAKVGILSRWPFLCYVEWDRKRLGASPTWPRLKYEVEVWPHNTKLCATQAHFEASRQLSGTAIPITDVTDGPAGVNKIGITSGTNDFKPTQFLKLSGQTNIPDGDYIIDSVDTFTDPVTKTKKREISLTDTLTGLVASEGTVEAYLPGQDDGLNAAHMLYQLLFSRFPHGLGFPVEEFDISSLEALGVLLKEEDLRSTLTAAEFKTAASAIADILTDIGAMMTYNEATGLIEFRAIREGNSVAVLPADVVVGDPPEIGIIHVQEQPGDRKMFEYRDRLRSYSFSPVVIDDDGQASIEAVYGQQKIRLTTVRDFDTATQVALRRDQEDYSNQQAVKITANREARKLIPGQLFSVPGVSSVLLCLQKERQDALSGEVQITAIPNYYGIVASGMDTFQSGGILPDTEPSDEDEVVIPIEIPSTITVPGEILFGVARIRAGSDTLSSLIHLSADDVTFGFLGEEDGLHVGGTLDSQWDAGPGFIDLGPVITAKGPDIASALDLSASADKLAWQLGRQIAIVGSGTDSEIWFVRYLEALGGDSYRLREVLTARLDTARLTHPAGAGVVLMDESELKRFDDIILIPDASFHVKSQPVGNTSTALDDLLSEDFDVYGKGIRPMPVTTLYAGGPDSPSGQGYKLGEDVAVRWGYRGGPGSGADTSGAGNFGAGNATFSKLEFDGECILRILDGSTEKRKVQGSLSDFTLPDGSVGYEYTWAQIASDFSVPMGFGGNINFDVEVSFSKGVPAVEPDHHLRPQRGRHRTIGGSP